MKTVLVTGASTGIGRAAALRLAEKGFHVLAGVRKQKDADSWDGVKNVRAVFFDVTDENLKVDDFLDPLEKSEEVHLVNNAGIAVAGPIEAVPMKRWKEQFEVNVFGLLRATQLLLPFIRSTKGRIVNISSVSGLVAMPYLGPYAASKFTVEAISDSLRREMLQFGAKVIVVEPGPIATPIWEKGLGKKDALLEELPPKLQRVYGKDLTSFQKMVSISARDAVSVDKVSDAIEKALTLKNPKTRYAVGAKGPVLQALVGSMLPDKFVDSIFAREFIRQQSGHRPKT